LGSKEHVRELFGEVATGFEFERHLKWIEAESVEAWASFFMDHFPTMVTARATLGDRFGELRDQIVAIWRDTNEAGDGTLRFAQEYLLAIVRM
jgi:hypothetical protein